MAHNIYELIKHEDWFIKNAKRRAASELLVLQEQMDSLDNFRSECVKNIATIIVQSPTVLEIKSFKIKKTRLLDLISEALAIKELLSNSFDSFIRDYYNKYLPENSSLQVDNSELEAIRQNIVDRYNSQIKHDFKQLFRIVDDFIIKCKEAICHAQYK